MPNRPVHLDLLRLHLPIGGWVSILHRITGVVLFLALPVFIYLLDRSLKHPSGFEEVAAMLNSPAGKLMLLAVIASLAHHVFAGLRHLALDIHWGVEKNQARLSALWVSIATTVATLIAAWSLFS